MDARVPLEKNSAEPTRLKKKPPLDECPEISDFQNSASTSYLLSSILGFLDTVSKHHDQISGLIEQQRIVLEQAIQESPLEGQKPFNSTRPKQTRSPWSNKNLPVVETKSHAEAVPCLISADDMADPTASRRTLVSHDTASCDDQFSADREPMEANGATSSLCGISSSIPVTLDAGAMVEPVMDRASIETPASSASRAHASASSSSLSVQLRALSERLRKVSQHDKTTSVFTHQAGAAGGRFDSIISFMIMSNTVVLMLASEWEGWCASVKLGIEQDDGAWHNAENWFFVLEHLFCAFFLAELVINLYVQRNSFFDNYFNWIDSLVVIINVIDLYIFKPLGVKSLGHITVLRLLRVSRLVRTIKVVRTLRIFNGLRILVNAVVMCLLSLLWSMVLLGAFVVIGGLIMNTLLEEFIDNENNDYEVRLWCWKYYGTSLRSFYTMFEITMAGCWPNYVRPLLEDVSHLYGIFFLIYISFVVFAVIRIITAIFLKETLDAASNDADMLIAERTRKIQGLIAKLQLVFRHADVSGDGELTKEEFDVVMHDPQVKTYLSALELEVHENQLLFDLLDDGDGVISLDEFIQGVSRLKGQARTLDLVALQLDMNRVIKILNEMRGATSIRSSFNKRGSSRLHPMSSLQKKTKHLLSSVGGFHGDTAQLSIT